MNTNTGQIYEGDEIQQAVDRGEPVVPVSTRVARLMRLGLQKRRELKASRGRKAKARKRDAAEKASRRRNRR